MKAFVIIKSGFEWCDDVALNYSQLSIDHSVTSRLDSDDFRYFVSDHPFDLDKFAAYELVITIEAGAIFLFGFYEAFFANIPPCGKTHLADGVIAYMPRHGGESDLSRKIGMVDPLTLDSFVDSLSNMTTNLIDDSNMTYFMHNELPVHGPDTEELHWVATVSSGFFINAVMEHHGFSDDCTVHHFDISKISLAVRQYTIENWDGKHVVDWIGHIKEKFPLMQLFNRGKLTDRDPSFMRIWEAHINDFGQDAWLVHWKRYINLQHSYHRVNISDIDGMADMFDGIDTSKVGAIWWNGALKRIGANVMKDSSQSHRYAVCFIDLLREQNPDMFCYGSDHCATQFDGIRASQCDATVNSRSQLWVPV